jgi:hypothetical protein
MMITARWRRTAFLIAPSPLFVSCSTDLREHQAAGNGNKSEIVSSPQPITPATPAPLPATQIVTLADFERGAFYRKYKLNKANGWALTAGAYNNTYETPDIPDIAFEVQTTGDEVSGFGVVFYERVVLGDAELKFVYDLLQSIDTRATLNPRVKEYIKTNAERGVSQVNQATPTTFNKYKIYAGRVGPEQTISIEKMQ